MSRDVVGALEVIWDALQVDDLDRAREVAATTGGRVTVDGPPEGYLLVAFVADYKIGAVAPCSYRVRKKTRTTVGGRVAPYADVEVVPLEPFACAGVLWLEVVDKRGEVLARAHTSPRSPSNEPHWTLVSSIEIARLRQASKLSNFGRLFF